MLKSMTVYVGGNFSAIKESLSEEIDLNWHPYGKVEPSKWTSGGKESFWQREEQVQMLKW